MAKTKQLSDTTLSLALEGIDAQIREQFSLESSSVYDSDNRDALFLARSELTAMKAKREERTVRPARTTRNRSANKTEQPEA